MCKRSMALLELVCWDSILMKVVGTDHARERIFIIFFSTPNPHSRDWVYIGRWFKQNLGVGVPGGGFNLRMRLGMRNLSHVLIQLLKISKLWFHFQLSFPFTFTENWRPFFSLS